MSGSATASLFQAPSKMWNGVSINARQIKSVPSTLKTSGFTVPTRMNLVRVHMTTMDSTEGKNMAETVNPIKVSPVDGMESQMGKNMSEKERISKPGEGLYRRPVSYETQLAGFSLPVEESEKGKKGSQITNPLDAKISLEEKLLKLMEEFTKLETELRKLEAVEAMEADHSEHEYGRKKMELLARLETLYNEAKSSELSAQSCWESFLVSVKLLRTEFKLKRRPSCDTETTDPEISDKFLELNRLREAYPKVSQIQGNLVEFWKLTSFPVEAEFFRWEDLYTEWVGLAGELVHLLDSVIRKYPQDIEEVASSSPSPEAGKFFNVVELLSRFPGDLIRNDGNRSRVALNRDTFKGKYVLICCLHVPVLRVDISEFLLFVNLCNELYSTRDDFEMVVVARMNSLSDEEEVFHHFFSGFPKSCLAVPFEDNQRRDYICKVLGLGIYSQRIFQCLIQNDEGILLRSLDQRIFLDYGAEGFPFTEDILYKRDLELKDIIFEKESNWLERVLRCNDSSPDLVYKFNPAGGPREEMSISEFSHKLKNKHVGLYWCSGGEMTPELLGMYEQCREKQLDFEVVVVYMPFAIRTDPRIFQEKIDRLLKQHNVCDWWCLPFNNSVSVRFLHLTVYFDIPYVSYDCDKLVVVGPGVDHLDIYGFQVMLRQGIDAYPFTVEAGIKLVENELKQITWESLFVDGDISVFRGSDSSDSGQLRQLLKGKKNIILWIEGLCVLFPGDFKTLASIYKQTKAVEKEDFEMVFVGRPDLDVDGEMPWYICPVNALNSTKLKELVRLVGQYRNTVLVGFGEDGRVCSCPDICDVAEAGRFSLVDTLYCDVEHVLVYDECIGHEMEHFANP